MCFIDGGLMVLKVVDAVCFYSQRLSHQRLKDVSKEYSRHVLPIGWLEAPGDTSNTTVASTVEWWWCTGCTFSHYPVHIMKRARSFFRLLMYIGVIKRWRHAVVTYAPTCVRPVPFHLKITAAAIKRLLLLVLTFCEGYLQPVVKEFLKKKEEKKKKNSFILSSIWKKLSNQCEHFMVDFKQCAPTLYPIIQNFNLIHFLFNGYFNLTYSNFTLLFIYFLECCYIFSIECQFRSIQMKSKNEYGTLLRNS